MKGTIVGLVPVKGSSDRVKQKNLRSFCNTSLLELKLNQLKNVKGFNDIIVSSEDEEVLKVAESKGFSLHVRDPKYSTSEIPMSEVYSFIASEIHGDNIAWINVTNPLAETQIYEEACNLYHKMESKYDCLLSSVALQENVFFNGQPVNFKPYPWPRSQDLKGFNSLTFVINILKRSDMIEWGSCVGNTPYFYDLDKVDSWDIDDQADFDFCEFVYSQRLKGS